MTRSPSTGRSDPSSQAPLDSTLYSSVDRNGDGADFKPDEDVLGFGGNFYDYYVPGFGDDQFEDGM